MNRALGPSFTTTTSLKALLISAFACTAYSIPVMAETDVPPTVEQSEAGSPIATEVVAFRYLCRNCDTTKITKINVHRIQSIQGGVKTNYTHKPTFFPINRPADQNVLMIGDVSNLPQKVSSLIWSIYREPDGAVFVTFRLQISNDEIQRIAEEEVRKSISEKVWITSGDGGLSGALEAVRVSPWPVKEVYLELSFPPQYKVVTQSTVRVAQSDLDQGWVEIPVSVAPTSLSIFSSDLESRNAQFLVRYSYLGANAPSTLQFKSESTEAIVTMLKEAISQQNLQPGSPLTQGDVKKLEQQFRAAVVLSLTTNDAALLELIPESTFSAASKLMFREGNELLSPTDFESTRGLDSLKGFLDPVFNEIKTSNESFDTTTETDETKVTVSGKVSAEYDGDLGGEGSLQITKVDLDRIEREYGVKFREDTTTQMFVLTGIEVQYLSETAAESATSGFASITVVASEGRSFQGEQVVRASSSVPYNQVGEAVVDEGTIVPVGTVLCSMIESDEAPAGYVWLDEANRWPNAAWAGALAGTPMPDQRNLFLAGTDELTNLGSISTGEFMEDGRTIVVTANPSESGAIVNRSPRTVWGLQGDGERALYFFPSADRSEPQHRRWSTVGQYCAGGLSQIVCRPDHPWARQWQASLEEYGVTTTQHGPVSDNLRWDPLVSILDSSDLEISLNIPAWSSGPLETDELLPKHMSCRWMVRVE